LLKEAVPKLQFLEQTQRFLLTKTVKGKIMICKRLRGLGAGFVRIQARPILDLEPGLNMEIF
jgi:hypothetical protein